MKFEANELSELQNGLTRLEADFAVLVEKAPYKANWPSIIRFLTDVQTILANLGVSAPPVKTGRLAPPSEKLTIL